MKLTHLTLSVLFFGVSVVKAQQIGNPAVAKQDTAKASKKTLLKVEKKLSKKDSLKRTKPKKHPDPDYCPACGMG